jgi:hypothetical protein
MIKLKTWLKAKLYAWATKQLLLESVDDRIGFCAEVLPGNYLIQHEVETTVHKGGSVEGGVPVAYDPHPTGNVVIAEPKILTVARTRRVQ